MQSLKSLSKYMLIINKTNIRLNEITFDNDKKNHHNKKCHRFRFQFSIILWLITITKTNLTAQPYNNVSSHNLLFLHACIRT